MEQLQHLINKGERSIIMLLALLLVPVGAWAEDYGLTVAGVQVTDENASNITGDNITGGTVSYNASTNTLTLNEASITIGSAETPFIESSLDELKIVLISGNSGYYSVQDEGTTWTVFKSTNPDAVLTFEATSEYAAPFSINSNGDAYLIQAFSADYPFKEVKYNGTSLFMYESGWRVQIGNLQPTSFDYAYDEANNKVGFTLFRNNTYNPESVCDYYYTIDYADEGLEDVAKTKSELVYDEAYQMYNPAPVYLDGPATITAWVESGTAKSAEKEGRYFGFAQSVLNVPYGTTEADLPAVIPATGEEIEISYEGNVTGGKIDLSNTTTIGDNTTVTAFFTSTANPSYAILNSYANLTVNIVPPAPTIVFDETKDYLSTDVVSITLPEALAEDENAAVKYSWVEDCPDGDGTDYSDETKVELPAGTHTLYAWVKYHEATAGDAVYSERVSQVFTVKTDISTAIVDDFSQTATYTGSAIVPEVMVYDSEETMNVLDAADYDLTFQQLGGDEPVGVEAMVNVGTYMITLVGKGTYGGSMVITQAFEVTKADPVVTAPTALTGLTYNGEEQTLVEAGTTSTGTTMKYKLGANDPYTETLPVGLNAGTYTVYYMVSGSDNYNDFEPETTVSVTIAKKVLTEDMVSLSAETFEYNGEAQQPEVTVSDGEALTEDDYTVANEGGTAVGSYTVTVTAAEGGNYSGEVTLAFDIVNRTLTIGKDVAFSAGQKWASFYTTTESLTLPEGLMAYIVTAVGDASATVAPISYVPQGVPVLIENESTTVTDNTSADGNMLQGTTEATPVSSISGTVYGLYNNRLLKVTSGTIPAGRAYLAIAAASGASQLWLDFGDGVTGIRMATAEEETDGGWYALDGRKLQKKPARSGLYIKNGHKVLVK